MAEVKKETIDEHHACLRAACLKLRAYAHALANEKGRATIQASEVYDRLDRALYPTTPERRREPLDVLLDRARADEVSDHVDALEDLREKVATLRREIESPEKSPPELSKLLEMFCSRLKTIEDGVSAFLEASEETAEAD